MFEILALLVLLAWIFFSIWLAARVTRVARQGVMKALIFLVLAPGFSALPLADEIIGKFQFDRLCGDDSALKIHSTVVVGEELYFPDGRWRLTSTPPLSTDEYKRVRQVYDSLVRWDLTQTVRTHEPIPISETETKVYSRKDNSLLATFRSYGTRGGRVSQMFERPTLVRDSCMPVGLSMLDQRILPFRALREDQK